MRWASIANVPNELVNQWFDDFYLPGSDWYRESSTEKELEVLGEFNAFYDTRVSSLPEILEEMHGCFQWKEVVGNTMGTRDAKLGRSGSKL